MTANYPRQSRGRTQRAQPPTDKMMAFMLSLARERLLPEYGADANSRVAFLQREVDAGRLGKYGAMDVIDRLKAAPYDRAAQDAGEALQPGVYRRNGAIFVVKPNRAGTALHARRLVEIGGRRLTEADTVVQIEFRYEPGAIRELRPQDMMTLEEARPFIIRYGRCIFCNTRLRDATSVERGVGPVCARRFAPPRPPVAEPDPARDARLGDLLARLQRRD